jgi:Methyltransferase domain
MAKNTDGLRSPPPRVRRIEPNLASSQAASPPKIPQGSETLNQHGDFGRLIPGELGLGTDINLDRQDDLDMEASKFVTQRVQRFGTREVVGVDFGCGLGAQSVRFALSGANVYAIDLADTADVIQQLYGSEISAGNSRGEPGQIFFVQTDIRDFDFASIQTGADFFYSQRALHYLRFQDAKKLLMQLRAISKVNTRLFIGVSGLDSPLGRNYAGRSQPIRDRFAPLSLDEEVRKHQILQPVSLYTESDLALLLLEAGFCEVRLWRSEFGNIKGIFKVVA